MSKTRVAVAGAGTIGRAHMGVLQASARCALSALVDPAPAAVELAAQAGVPLYVTLEELLARECPDGIVLSTPNALHVPQALRCIEAGMAVLLEKPIAPTVAQAEQFVAA